jgi:hypothetical protein
VRPGVPDLKERQGHKALWGLRVGPALKVPVAPKVRPVRLVPRASRVLPEVQVGPARRALKASRAFKVTRGPRVLPVR